MVRKVTQKTKVKQNVNVTVHIGNKGGKQRKRKAEVVVVVNLK